MEEKTINYPRNYFATKEDIQRFNATFGVATMEPDEYGRYLMGNIQAVRWPK